MQGCLGYGRLRKKRNVAGFQPIRKRGSRSGRKSVFDSTDLPRTPSVLFSFRVMTPGGQSLHLNDFGEFVTPTFCAVKFERSAGEGWTHAAGQGAADRLINL